MKKRSRSSHETKSASELDRYQRTVVGSDELETTGSLQGLESEATDAPQPAPVAPAHSEAPFQPVATSWWREKISPHVPNFWVGLALIVVTSGLGWAALRLISFGERITALEAEESNDSAEDRIARRLDRLEDRLDRHLDGVSIGVDSPPSSERLSGPSVTPPQPSDGPGRRE